MPGKNGSGSEVDLHMLVRGFQSYVAAFEPSVDFGREVVQTDETRVCREIGLDVFAAWGELRRYFEVFANEK